MNKFIYILFISICVVYSCTHQDFMADDIELTYAIAKTGNINEYIQPDGIDLTAIPNQDKKNPLTPEKIALGKMLFYEPGIGLVGKNIALRQTYSCRTE